MPTDDVAGDVWWSLAAGASQGLAVHRDGGASGDESRGDGGDGRGLHSSTILLNLSPFCH
jgi:hypothetical protein